MIRNGMLALLLLLFCTQEAIASRQHRCDGRVQYRPCAEKIEPGPSRPYSSERAALSSSPGQGRTIAINVENPSLRDFNGNEGVWTGAIKASGTIHLKLQFYRDGKIISTRYMGKTKLSGQKSSFMIRSALPHGNNWSWKIVAYQLSQA